jgi:small subunit ribosomal protein S3
LVRFQERLCDFLGEDIKIRKYLEPQLKEAMVSHIDIAVKNRQRPQRRRHRLRRPSGRRDRPRWREHRPDQKRTWQDRQDRRARIDVVEVKNPDLDATLIGKWIASELENRQSSVRPRRKPSKNEKSRRRWLPYAVPGPLRRS